MLHQAKHLSSNQESFREECDKVRNIFLRLKYPLHLVNSMIKAAQEKNREEQPVSIVLPYKDQRSANAVRKQCSELGKKIGKHLRPVYTSRKIGDDLNRRENKSPMLSQQCVVDHFECDRCEAGYVGYTSRHLYKRTEVHKLTTTGKHIREDHAGDLNDLAAKFRVLPKCKGKLDRLIFEILYIRDLKPSLNKQLDSIKSKLFTWIPKLLNLYSFIVHICMTFKLVFFVLRVFKPNWVYFIFLLPEDGVMMNPKRYRWVLSLNALGRNCF